MRGFMPATKLTTKWCVGEADADVIADARKIRETVFIKEQLVSYDDEMDGTDGEATHLVAYGGGVPAATGRIRVVCGEEGLPQAFLGCIAVLKERRGERPGKFIVRLLIERAVADGFIKVHIHSQTAVHGFYEKLGFVAYGDEFDEAGIRHISMVCGSNYCSPD